MTSTTTDTLGHTSPVTAGHVTIAEVGGRSVWLYVIALLPGRDVFGVNLGTYLHSVPDEGLSFATAPVSSGDHDSPLDRLGESLSRALVTFLGAAGLPDPTASPTAPTVDRDAIERARREGAAEVQRHWDEWNERATRMAHQYANDNNLCGEFDRCMEEIGLEPRWQDYDMRVTVTYRFSVTARDSDDAYELAGEFFRDYDTDPDIDITFT